MMRKIDEIIIHCTATPEGRDCSAADIRRWHIEERGFTDIGYHFVIRPDGKVEEGRKLAAAGAHCLGHNIHSIGIVYVGGCDKAMRPKDTRTAKQRASLSALIRRLLTEFPGAAVHGHNEYSSKTCPSFNVKDWIREEGI